MSETHGVFPSWQEHWQGMPEFLHKDLRPCQQIIVNFEKPEDVAAFSKLVGQNLTNKTDTMWFPPKVPEVLKDKWWISES